MTMWMADCNAGRVRGPRRGGSTSKVREEQSASDGQHGAFLCVRGHARMRPLRCGPDAHGPGTAVKDHFGMTKNVDEVCF
jgi:hypothetical protein